MNEVFKQIKIVSENIFTKDLSEGASGNISYLIEESIDLKKRGRIDLPERLEFLSLKKFIISATGTRIYMIKNDPEKFFSIFSINEKGDGIDLYNDLKPSSELLSHLYIYNAFLKENILIKSILHVHPKFSLMLPLDDEKLLNFKLKKTHTEFDLFFKNGVGIVEKFQPGSLELAKNLAKRSLKFPLLILKEHGIFSYGTDLLEIYDRIEILESISKIFIFKNLLGQTF